MGRRESAFRDVPFSLPTSGCYTLTGWWLCAHDFAEGCFYVYAAVFSVYSIMVLFASTNNYLYATNQYHCLFVLTACLLTPWGLSEGNALTSPPSHNITHRQTTIKSPSINHAYCFSFVMQ
jgi:hypothetical protein